MYMEASKTYSEPEVNPQLMDNFLKKNRLFFLNLNRTDNQLDMINDQALKILMACEL